MPEPTDPAPRRRGVGGALLRPTRTHLIVAVILLVFGLVVTVQLRNRSSEQDYSGLQRTELVAILDDLTAESRRLESEIADLRSTQQQLRTGADRRQVALAEADRRRSMLSILGGTAPAQGEGVRVVITDPNHAMGEATLLNAIGELRDAGAEVIELNDSVRVVASTWVETRGEDLVVDGTVLDRPIQLEAIGDPHALTEALQFRGGLASEIQDANKGGSVSVAAEDTITVESVREPTAPKFARPA